MSDEEKKVCRLCLAVAQVACYIFPDESCDNDDLPNRIMSCAQIQVKEGDGLPSTICHQCLAQVDLSYQFRLQCEKSDAKLRQSILVEKNSEWESVESSQSGVDVAKGSDKSERVEAQMNGVYMNGNVAIWTERSEGEAEGIEEGEDEASSDSEYDEMEEGARMMNGVDAQPSVGDSESVDGWDMMKFTPEVIINEEDSKGSCDGVENGSLMARNMNSLVEQQLYQLSQVEAILRNHGTEIKVQGGTNQVAASAIQKRGVSTVATAGAAGGQERWQEGAGGNYFPMYGVEAVLAAAAITQDESAPSHPKSRRSSSSSQGNGISGGEKLFKCRLCPKSYSFSSALSRHKAVHNTMLRPYVCVICKKGFAEPDKLERHSRTHLVDRTWRCNNCGRLFKALNTYERHVTTICSYRNKENGGASGTGLTATPVATPTPQQTVVYFNS